jgi:hypothetical protein
LAFPAHQVVDCLDILHGSPQAAHIGQAGDGYFHGNANGQTGRARRRPQQNAYLVAGFNQLTGERPTDEAGPAGEKNH